MTRRMTVAQALVEFLAHQWTVDGDHRERTVPGIFGIFGHGNVPGLGEALHHYDAAPPHEFPFRATRNEQAMVHQAVGYARMHRRRGTYACTASVGPGAANMLTGAALATANRLPALLLVSDTFASGAPDPVLQQLEHPHDPALQVADAFRPVSRFFAPVQRPEQLFAAALGALRVLTDPAETGAVTLVLPEDVQAEAVDVPEEFLADRDWRIRRPPPEQELTERVAGLITDAQRPLVVAGGGVFHSGAEQMLREFAERSWIPVATTQAGGGVLPWDHPLSVGGLGVTGSAAANVLAAHADLVIGFGTRYSDFTASRSVFADPSVRFVNINVAPFDTAKLGASVPVVADAREALSALTDYLSAGSSGGERAPDGYVHAAVFATAEWDAIVDEALAPAGRDVPGQPEILGAVARAVAPHDLIVAAAGSLPGDLQKLWRPSDPLGYHVEYAYSCMGYEIAGGLGAKRGLLADGDDRDVIVLVGDGGYLMLHSELPAAVAEGLRLIVVVVDNQGYSSIGRLSESVGAGRLGTDHRSIPVDIAANARSYGVRSVAVAPGPGVLDDLAAAIADAKQSDGPTVIVVPSDPSIEAPDGGGWWDVPVAEVSDSVDVDAARKKYERQRRRQRPHLGPKGGA